MNSIREIPRNWKNKFSPKKATETNGKSKHTWIFPGNDLGKYCKSEKSPFSSSSLLLLRSQKRALGSKGTFCSLPLFSLLSPGKKRRGIFFAHGRERRGGGGLFQAPTFQGRERRSHESSASFGNYSKKSPFPPAMYGGGEKRLFSLL